MVTSSSWLVKMEHRCIKDREKTVQGDYYVCRDSKGTILCATSNKIGDHNILVVETLVIREAIVGTIQKQMEQSLLRVIL